MTHHHLGAPVLTSDVVRLEPLAPGHLDGLRAAAEGARAARSLADVPTPDTAEAFLARSLERARQGAYAPFAQVDAVTGRVLGHTAFLNPRWFPGGRMLAVEVGSSWLTPAARGTAVNSASKLLLLTHAFEVWEVCRLDIKTDVRNAAARAGIEAIGARLEGVLHAWQPSMAEGEEGRPRDTAMFAVTAGQWPGVRDHLRERIAAKRTARG